MLPAFAAEEETPATDVSAAGARLFMRHCAMCHGQDGRAQTPMARKLGVRDLTASTLSGDEIRRSVLEGRRNERGAQAMPAFAGRFDEDAMAALVTHVLGLRAPPAGD